jgi:hypothetical protein
MPDNKSMVSISMVGTELMKSSLERSKEADPKNNEYEYKNRRNAVPKV